MAVLMEGDILYILLLTIFIVTGFQNDNSNAELLHHRAFGHLQGSVNISWEFFLQLKEAYRVITEYAAGYFPGQFHAHSSGGNSSRPYSSEPTASSTV